MEVVMATTHMWTAEEITDIVRQQILMERLELAELGIELDQLTLDAQLLEEDGIGLDSVDGLEVVVGLQETFGIEIPDVDRDFITTHIKDIRSIVALVCEKLGQS
jgi:acyl carrier protein